LDTFIDNTHGYIPVGATIKLSNTLKIFLAINTRPQIDQIFEGFNIELQTIVNSGVTHSYRKGEIIFREGGIPNGVFINAALDRFTSHLLLAAHLPHPLTPSSVWNAASRCRAPASSVQHAESRSLRDDLVGTLKGLPCH